MTGEFPFDPYKGVRDLPEGTQLDWPGEFLTSCARQASEIAAASKDIKELQDKALFVMNLTAAFFQAGIDSDPDSKFPCSRKELSLMFAAGVEAMRLAVLSREPGVSVEEALTRFENETIRKAAQRAAEALHNKPGGTRERQRLIREAWASGKYSSRDRCAEEEAAALGISFSAARKALRNTPEPHRG